MIDPELRTFLEGGSAQIVGVTDPSGAPYAARGWGLRVIEGGTAIRLLVNAQDAEVFEALVPDGWVALTSADVPSLYATQLKGRARSIVPATDADQAIVERYFDEFAADVLRTDGTPREFLARLLPAAYLVLTMTVDELFNQTPGPGAGAQLGGDPPTTTTERSA